MGTRFLRRMGAVILVVVLFAVALAPSAAAAPGKPPAGGHPPTGGPWQPPADESWQPSEDESWGQFEDGSWGQFEDGSWAAGGANRCAPTYYRICFGDTLSMIARRFGVTVWQLQQWNGIGNANRIYAGRTLAIYSCGHPQPQPKPQPQPQPQPNPPGCSWCQGQHGQPSHPGWPGSGWNGHP